MSRIMPHPPALCVSLHWGTSDTNFSSSPKSAVPDAVIVGFRRHFFSSLKPPPNGVTTQNRPDVVSGLAQNFRDVVSGLTQNRGISSYIFVS